MLYSPLLVFHVLTGLLGLMSGAAAIAVRKGRGRHTYIGNIFAGSMLAMAASGILISVERSLLGNVSVGIVTAYLVATGWYTAHRGTPIPGLFDYVACGVAAAVALANTAFAILAFRSPTGKFIAYPAAALLVIAIVAAGGVYGDLRLMLSRGVRGSSRLIRHLWRMCFALLIAGASIFSRTHLFPTWMKTYGLLGMLTAWPLIVIGLWVWRFRKPKQSPMRGIAATP
jgi:hypothetical protein